MNLELNTFIGDPHIDILEQLGNNEFYNIIYLEILEEFKFSMQIHVDSLPSSNGKTDSHNTVIGYLPSGMIKNVALSIDEKMPKASLPLKTCIWYEISRQLVQQSSFRYNFRNFH